MLSTCTAPSTWLLRWPSSGETVSLCTAAAAVTNCLLAALIGCALRRHCVCALLSLLLHLTGCCCCMRTESSAYWRGVCEPTCCTRRGDPIGSHFDHHQQLLWLQVENTELNAGLNTGSVSGLHWENMLYFTPDNEGYSGACSADWLPGLATVGCCTCWRGLRSPTTSATLLCLYHNVESTTFLVVYWLYTGCVLVVYRLCIGRVLAVY